MRIEDALEKFLLQLQADGRSRHTIGQYRRHIKLLARWAHDVAPCCDDVERLDHEAVARFLASPVATGRLRGGQKLATSANCLRLSVKGFFSYLHRAGFIAHDPGRLIRRALCSPPPPKALSDDEEKRLLDVLSKATGAEGERDHALFHLMLASGICRVPYHLPELLAEPTRPVGVFEGEKDVENVTKLGFLATTNPEGAGKWGNLDPESVAKAFRGRCVYSVADKDPPGRAHARDVARRLWGVAKEIRILELPGDDVKDVSDWIAAGGTAEELTKLMEDAALLREPPAEEAAQDTPPDKDEEEEDIEAQEVPEYKPFPVEELPGQLGKYATSAATAIGCDVAFVAVPMLSILAGAIGNTRRLELKEGYSEPAIIWSALVAESGTAKTPGLNAVIGPVHAKQKELNKANAAVRKQFAREQKRNDADLRKYSASHKLGGTDLPPMPPDTPKYPCVYVADVTREKVVTILEESPRGLTLIRDELSGWFSGLTEYKRQNSSDVAFWLEANQAGTYSAKRMNGTDAYVEHATVSVMGGIQPGTLKRCLGAEHEEDGLAARFFFAMPPRPLGKWSERTVPAKLKAEYGRIVEWLYELQLDFDDFGQEQPRLLRLTEEARKIWIEFHDSFVEEGRDLEGAEGSAWSKLRGGAARLALEVHMCRLAQGDTTARVEFVDAKSMAAGCKLARWFANESKRVYRRLHEGDRGRQVRELLEIVERHGGHITVRELMRASRKYGNSSEKAEEALNKLLRLGRGGWQAQAPVPGGGWSTRVFTLNWGGDDDTCSHSAGQEERVSSSSGVDGGNAPPRREPGDESEEVVFTLNRGDDDDTRSHSAGEEEQVSSSPGVDSGNTPPHREPGDEREEVIF